MIHTIYIYICIYWVPIKPVPECLFYRPPTGGLCESPSAAGNAAAPVRTC